MFVNRNTAAVVNDFAATVFLNHDLNMGRVAGKLAPELALLTLPKQPAEMLFNVREDPQQFRNLADVAEDAAVLRQARALLDRWKEETGDSVPANPTRDRGGLHDATERSVKRGEFPGAARNATSNHQPGPIRLKP